jgi:hypothetical protein
MLRGDRPAQIDVYSDPVAPTSVQRGGFLDEGLDLPRGLGSIQGTTRTFQVPNRAGPAHSTWSPSTECRIASAGDLDTAASARTAGRSRLTSLPIRRLPEPDEHAKNGTRTIDRHRCDPSTSTGHALK